MEMPKMGNKITITAEDAFGRRGYVSRDLRSTFTAESMRRAEEWMAVSQKICICCGGPAHETEGH